MDVPSMSHLALDYHHEIQFLMLVHNARINSARGAHDERRGAYVQRNLYMSMLYYFEQARCPDKVDCVF